MLFRSPKLWVAILIVPFAILTTACGQSDEEKAQEDLAEMFGDLGGETRSKEVVRSWPDRFCTLSEGMTREEVQEVMGEPTSSYSDSTANQDEWDGYNVSVTAFYDIDDRVEQLDDSTGESNLPCDY